MFNAVILVAFNVLSNNNTSDLNISKKYFGCDTKYLILNPWFDIFYFVTLLEIRKVSNVLFNFYCMISKELIMLIVLEF